MPRKMRGMILAAAMAFMGIGAYAETVSISTYYPSPYGSYQNLDTGGFTSTGAANLATTSGGVAIGATGTPDATTKFYVAGGRSLLNTTMVGEVQSGFSTIEDRGATGLALIPDGTLTKGIVILENGNVGVGLTNPTYKLQVAGNANITGSLRLCEDGNPSDCGVMKVYCESGECWPVYR